MKPLASAMLANKRKQSSKCEVCDVMFSNDQELNSHLTSKDHQTVYSKTMELQRPLRLCDPLAVVAVSHLSTNVSLHELEILLTSCGEVKQIMLSKSMSNAEPVCLIEFASVSSVEAALKNPPIHYGKPLSVSKYYSESSSGFRDVSLDREVSRKKVCTEAEKTRSSSSNSSICSKTYTSTLHQNRTPLNSTNSNHNSKSAIASSGEKLLQSLEVSSNQYESFKSSLSELSHKVGKEQKSSISKVIDLNLAEGRNRFAAEVQRKATVPTAEPPEKSSTNMQEKTVVKIPENVAAVAAGKHTSEESDKLSSKISGSKERSKEPTSSSSEEILQSVPSSLQIPKVKVDDKLYDEKIISFVNELQVNLPKLENMFMQCFYSIERAIALLNVEFNCYMFGSSYTGLCWDGSDLDVYIQWGQVVTNTDVVLNECRKVMFRSRQFERVIIIKARTPLIKCLHKKTGIESDISFKSRLGVYNSVLIKMLLVFDERVKPMILFLKYWASKNDLLGSNKVNSYCLVWMVIYFLQTQNILPTIDYLNNFDSNKAFYSGWNVSFFNLSVAGIDHLKKLFLEQSPYKEKSIRQLLLEFFDFYLTFDYGKSVLCPFIGSSIPRTDFEQLKNIPSSMSWFTRIQRTCAVEDRMFDRIKTFCLQDPIELTFNIGKCMTPKLKDHFKLCCKTATNILITEKFDKIVTKLLRGGIVNHSNCEASRPNVSEQEVVSMSIDQLLRSLKKSQCHSMSMKPSQERAFYGSLFDRNKWISDLFYAFLFLLNKVFKFEISASDQKSCTDPVLNLKYESFQSEGQKLDLKKCQIIHCKGSAVLFYNRKKYKSLPIPMSLASKLDIEKEMYRNDEILRKELKARTEEECRKEKFGLVFCFNPVQNEDKVIFTCMRYFDQTSMPAAVNYQLFFNYIQANFLSMMSKSIHYVQSNKSKISLGLNLDSLCMKYENLLMDASETVPALKKSQEIAKITPKVVEFIKKKTLNENKLITDDPVLQVKSESYLPSLEKDGVNHSEEQDDSDVEIVPVEPKVFECIDVE